MIRWIVGLSCGSLICVAVVAWAMSSPVEVKPLEKGSNEERRGQVNEEQKPQPHQRPEVGGNLVASGPQRARPSDLPKQEISDQLAISDLRVTLRYSQEVPSPRSGTLRLLATPIKDGEPLPAPDRIIKRKVPVLIRPVGQSEKPEKTYSVQGSDRPWRVWTESDTIEPDSIMLILEERVFKALREGDIVQGDDIVGVIDVDLAAAELSIKVANLSASEAKREATVKTRDEALTRFEANKAANKIARGAVSDEEVRASNLTYYRYVAEVVAEQQNVKKSAAELRQSWLVIKQHVLRVDPSVRVGRVKTIYKKEGEAVKEQESVMLIQNQEDLQVEGLVEIQQARRLRPNQKVFVEAPVQKAPLREIAGHREEILAVAVSKGVSPWVISSSADRTVRALQIKQTGDNESGWALDREKKVWWLDHPVTVRAMVCSPKEAKANLLLTGAADGSARLWNLDKLDEQARELKTRHKSSINAVAFSSDGQWCATGGEDNAICVCNVATGELADFKNDAHKGAVTSLAFTKGNKLVSAGRDSALKVWNVADGKLTQERELRGRLGTVDELGVSPDGATVLFDQGKELRVLSVNDGTMQGMLQNSTGSVNFTTLALFAPNGKTVLTAGASDNRLQLWRNPTQGRGTELRQYMWTSGHTTCAAFDPDSRIIVTGTQDKQVLIWGMPADKDIEESKEPNAYISLIDESLDSGARQVKVRAIVEKKPEGLIPGATATLVVMPQK